jgi:hypothetical protein
LINGFGKATICKQTVLSAEKRTAARVVGLGGIRLSCVDYNLLGAQGGGFFAIAL